MKNIDLKIEGMHCDGCAKRLEKVLNNIEGVESAKVSFNDKCASVEYTENVSIEELKEAIVDAGFEVIG